mmetsp:Transcript_7374/g.10247  ORF Transcript_7374/g.10247 Transcript_7374/m.10247 type:complete len:331 (+) Transcript_7374:141-1133(+)
MAASAQSLRKAKELEAKGEGCLRKFSFFGGGNAKYEDASECFDDAGKMYVMAKAYAEGAAAYERAAEFHLKHNGEFEAGTSSVKAAEASQKLGDIHRCVKNYEAAIGYFAGLGKCAMAANAAKKCAELLEENAPHATDPQESSTKAIEIYKEAVELYEAENRPQAATGCREKIAVLSATVGDYETAMISFEALGKDALNSNLGKFNAKKWFTNAILCALARDDSVKANNKLQEFSGLDFSFDEKTREFMLCSALIAALDANDQDAIATAAAEYDKVKRLDPWTTKILLAIKSHVSPPAHGGPDDDDDHTHPTEHVEPPGEDDADELPDLT